MKKVLILLILILSMSISTLSLASANEFDIEQYDNDVSATGYNAFGVDLLEETQPLTPTIDDEPEDSSEEPSKIDDAKKGLEKTLNDLSKFFGDGAESVSSWISANSGFKIGSGAVILLAVIFVIALKRR